MWVLNLFYSKLTDCDGKIVIPFQRALHVQMNDKIQQANIP